MKDRINNKVDELITTIQSSNVKKNDRILFISSDNLASCVNLLDNGYTKLYLLSNNKKIYNFPYYTQIRYIYDEKNQIHYPKNFFKIIIMPLCIFKQDILNFIEDGGILILLNSRAKSEYGMLDDTNIDKLEKEGYEVNRISGYITIITALRSPPPKEIGNNGIDLLCYSIKEDGILIYSRILKERLENELSQKVNLIHKAEESVSGTIIIEYHRGFQSESDLLFDIDTLNKKGSSIILENHSPIGKELYQKILKLGSERVVVTYRSSEMAYNDQAKVFGILPHISYVNIPYMEPFQESNIRIGSFGFLGKQKGVDEIIRLCRRLKLPAILLLGYNPLGSMDKYERAISNLKSKYIDDKRVKIIENTKWNYNVSDSINIIYGRFTDEQILFNMSKCSHIAFAHRNRIEESGTMKYAKRLNRPIFALDSYQAKIGQIYRFKKFVWSTPFRIFIDSMTEYGLSLLRNKIKIDKAAGRMFCAFVDFLDQLLLSRSPSAVKIMNLKANHIRDEDGFEYLTHYLVHGF